MTLGSVHFLPLTSNLPVYDFNESTLLHFLIELSCIPVNPEMRRTGIKVYREVPELTPSKLMCRLIMVQGAIWGNDGLQLVHGPAEIGSLIFYRLEYIIQTHIR